MGEVIRKTAAAPDIVADGKTTLTNARAKGGFIETEAVARLESLLGLADSVSARLAAAKSEAAPHLAELDAADVVADQLVGRTEDDLWNLLGRPAHDAAFAVLFPGGLRWYTGGDVREEPDRIELLADLLEGGVHPRLVIAPGSPHSVALRDGAAALRAKVEAARPYKTRIALAEKMELAAAHAVQLALTRLKKALLAQGLSEAQVHAVIPDRPSSHGATTATTGTAGGGAPTPAS